MQNIFRSAIGRKLLFSFVLVILLIFSSLWMITEISMTILKEEVYDTYENAISSLSSQFSESLEKYRIIGLSLVTNTDFIAFSQAPQWEPGDVWEYVKILSSIRLFSDTNDLRSQITVYIPSRGKGFSSGNGLFDILPDDLFWKVREEKNHGSWFLRQGINGQQLLTLVQENTFENQGLYTAIDIEISDIQALLQRLNTQQKGDAFAIFEGGKVISDTGVSLPDKVVERLLAEKDQFSLDQENGAYRYISHKIEGFDIIMGMRLNEQLMYRHIFSFRRTMIVAAILLGIFCFGFAGIIYKSLLTPFQKLLSGIHEMGGQNFKYRLTWKKRRDEFELIFSRFNEMAEHLDTLINEGYRQQINLHIINMKLLQAQINPHFLFNCLSFIYQCSKAENNDAAGQMSMYLAKYFRYTMRADIAETSLHDELQNLEAYIKVQQLRFPGQIDYSASLPRNLEGFSVPRLLIQPLVENILVHGVKSTLRAVRVTIQVLRTDGVVCILVTDDGPGMSREECDKMNAKIYEQIDPDEETGSYGLSNIFWRLRTSFGNGASLKLSPVVSGGLQVAIGIPDAALPPPEQEKGADDHVSYFSCRR